MTFDTFQGRGERAEKIIAPRRRSTSGAGKDRTLAYRELRHCTFVVQEPGCQVIQRRERLMQTTSLPSSKAPGSEVCPVLLHALLRKMCIQGLFF